MVKSWTGVDRTLEIPMVRQHFHNIKERVSCVKVSPNGKYLAIATEMGKVLSMNLKSFKIEVRNPLHKGAVY